MSWRLAVAFTSASLKSELTPGQPASMNWRTSSQILDPLGDVILRPCLRKQAQAKREWPECSWNGQQNHWRERSTGQQLAQRHGPPSVSGVQCETVPCRSWLAESSIPFVQVSNSIGALDLNRLTETQTLLRTALVTQVWNASTRDKCQSFTFSSVLRLASDSLDIAYISSSTSWVHEHR